jgi:hypothetical protein
MDDRRAAEEVLEISMNRRHEPSRRIDQPEPGFFKLRKVKGGPFVAARIDYEAPLWSAEIDGQPCGLPDPDPAHADGVFRIWTTAVRIDSKEYDRMREHKATAPLTDPVHNAHEPINLNKLPTIY